MVILPNRTPVKTPAKKKPVVAPKALMLPESRGGVPPGSVDDPLADLYGSYKSNADLVDPIVAPDRTTMGDAWKGIKSSGLIPSYSSVGFNAITPKTATAQSATGNTATAQTASGREVGGITDTLGNDYFDLLEQQATKKLEDKFFAKGSGSLSDQMRSQMAKRGLLGSGVEVGATNNLYKSFGDELVDLQSNLAQQRLETAKELAFRNKDIELKNADTANQFTLANTNTANQFALENARTQNELEKFNTQSANEINLSNTQDANKYAFENAKAKMEAAQKDRDWKGFLSDLGFQASANEAKTATDFDTKMFEQEVALNNNKRDQFSKYLDSLNTAMNNKLIDKDSRDAFESLFGSNMISNLGSEDWIKQYNEENSADYLRKNNTQDYQWYEPGKGWTRNGVDFSKGAISKVPKKF